MESTSAPKSLEEMLEELTYKKLLLVSLKARIGLLQSNITSLEKGVEPANSEIHKLSYEIAWAAKMSGVQIDGIKNYAIPNLYVPLHIVAQIRDPVVQQVNLGTDFGVIEEESAISVLLERLDYVVESRGLAQQNERMKYSSPLYRDFSNEELSMLVNEVVTEFKKSTTSTAV